MRVYISMDAEGISGIYKLAQVMPGHTEYDYARKLMAGDINAAVAGACDAGAENVFVCDAHNGGDNLHITDLDERTILCSGADRPFSMAEGAELGYDAALHDMTVNALRVYSVSFLVFGFNIFGSAFFTGLNDGTDSALISFLRTLVFQVAAILLLPRWLDINGIWLAVTAAESLTLLVTVSLLAAKRRKYHY